MKVTTLFILLVVVAHASPRTSTDYAVASDSMDSAGSQATSVDYINSGSAGGVTGISTVAAPAETAKSGFIGQLYEVTALQLAATPATVNETSTRQLSGAQMLDDLTTIAIPAAAISWSVASGPLTGIDANGIATAATVYQNTTASVQGSYAGITGSLDLSVLDTIPDNFRSYAGDVISDAWQVQYFGPENPLAAALLDPDGDGQNNLFEFIAGLVPTDSNSRFSMRSEPVPGQPGQHKITFTPRLSDRNYSILASTTLLDNSWTPLTGGIISDNGAERTVTDPNATEGKKFYRVGIEKP